MKIPLLTLNLCLNSAVALDLAPASKRAEFAFTFQVTFKENDSHLLLKLSGKDSHTLHLSPARIVAKSSRGIFRKRKKHWNLNTGNRHQCLIQSRQKSFSVYTSGRHVITLPREEGDISLSVEEVNNVAVERTRFQPYETTHFADDFMRRDGQSSGWKTLAGKWQMAKATQLDFAASPFRLQAVDGKNAHYVTGYAFWRDYLFQASTRLHSKNVSTGLCFYRMGESEFIFRWNGPKSQFELLHRNGEKIESLATREGELEQQQWYRMGVAACGRQVRCFVDETEVLRAKSEYLAQGGIGLYASTDSGPVEFDDVLVEGSSFEERKFASMKHSRLVEWIRSVQPRSEIINPTFIKDRYMQNWTSVSSLKTEDTDSEGTAKENYYGYTFFRAPSDWWRSTGRWDAYSRWSCRPEWSFFAGTDDQIALIWNKRRFPGDVQVDIYAANPMVTMRPPFYGETNLNLAICGDGKNPFSGYTVSMGGWNQPVTKLYRKNEVVAMSTEAIIPASVPSDYHREWFHLQLVKTGKLVTFSFEGKKTFEFRDTEPLKGTRIGIWSLESGVSIARAQIRFSKETEMWTKVEKGNVFNRAKDWQTLDGEQGALPAAIEESGKNFVRLINRKAAGTFAVAPPGLPINLAERSVISFSYRTTKAASANIYFEIGGHWHQLRFTGPDTRLPVTKLGEFRSVKTDGRWHKAEFDLLPAILKSHTRGPLIIERVRIGLLEADDLLRAGTGSNLKGAHWDISDLEFRASGEEAGERIKVAGGDPLFEDFERGADSWENFGGPDGAVVFADQNAGGTGTSLQLYKQTHGGVFGARWKINPVNLEVYPTLDLDYRMPDNVRTGLLVRIGQQWFSIVMSPDSKRLLNNQAAVKVERDNRWHRLRIPLLELFTTTFADDDSRWVNEIIFADQAESGPNGYRGNIKGTRYWLDNVRFVQVGKNGGGIPTPTINPAQARRPHLIVRYPETLFLESFEPEKMPWRDWCEGTVLRFPRVLLGEHCARIFGYRENAYFSTMMWERWIDLNRYPIMSFDYRIPGTAGLGFAINLNDYFYLLPFSREVNLETVSERRRGGYVSSIVGDCAADNRWHSTEINLLACLRKRFPGRKSFRIRDLRTQTMGGGNPLGQSCYFDNVAFHSRKPGKVRIQWATPPGTTAVKYSLNPEPDGKPDTTVARQTGELVKMLEGGTYYFHLSAQGGDGVSGETVHRKILLE